MTRLGVSRTLRVNKALQFSALDFNVVDVRLKYVGLQNSGIIISVYMGWYLLDIYPKLQVYYLLRTLWHVSAMLQQTRRF